MSLQEPVLRAPARPWTRPGQDSFFSKIYRPMFAVVFIATFIASWKYTIAEYGTFYGLGLGWIPALVVGMVFAGMWPIGLVVGATAFIIFRIMYGF